jgi:REP element-mobilizing transposase RayT
VELGAHVVMPNHVHGIIIINDERRGEVLSPRDGPMKNSGGETPPLHQPKLGQIVAYFKYQSTKQMNKLDNPGVITKFWHRNYYEHVIRNHAEWDRIHRYIESNPSMWAEDNENPDHR